MRVERKGALAVITLARLQASNAFDGAMVEDLLAAFGEAGLDPQVRAILLRAEGRAFSAGADLAWMRSMANASEAENLSDARRLALLMHTIDTSPKVTLASIQGPAFGGALGLISCCDIAVASNNAVFCASEVRLGLIPAVIGPYLVRAIGVREARRLIVAAEQVNAAEALRIGLVHDVVEAHELEGTAQRRLVAAMAGGPEAVAAAKAFAAELARPITQDLMEETARRIAAIRRGAEAREGLTAFLEKRKPGWLS